MPASISKLAEVDRRAELADDVVIGPFCVVGPKVKIGAGTVLQNNVTIIGDTKIGERNRFCPNVVVGGDPQDVSFRDGPTSVEIGDDNIFREGVTVNRGAEKEDHVTRVGNKNLLMANSHVAHNCRVYDNVILVNGVLLGGHVHVHDYAIISGNTGVHHFSTIGKLAFVSGGCRVPHDVPPFMMAAGSDNPEIKTVNIVGMRRRGMSPQTISLIKQAHRLVYREHKTLDAVREHFDTELGGVLPLDLSLLLNFFEQQRKGKLGRAREAMRDNPAPKNTNHLHISDADKSESQKQPRRRAA